MRLRVILLLSLGLNFALGAVWYFWLRSPAPAGREVSALPVRAPAPTNAAQPRVIVRRQFFTWAEVESADYRVYIANLRAIGCPEATTRDIIVADVNQLYAKRRATEIVAPDQQWWRSEPDPAVLQAAADKLRALDDERRALLTRLLGPGWELAAANGDPTSISGVSLTGPVLGSLSPEAKQAVLDLSASAQQQQQAYLDAQAKAGKAPDPAELARLRQQTRNELAKVLTPDQLEEYLLRYSNSAGNLRAELRGLSLTPDEFRTIFRARDAIDMQIQLSYSGDDPASVQSRQELEKQREAAIKQALDPDQYRLYQLTKDPIYSAAQAAVTQVGAPPDKVMPLYQVNQLSATERQRINNDPSLTAEEKAGALKIVQQDLEKSLQKLLGADAYRQYQKQQAENQKPSPGPSPPLPPELQELIDNLNSPQDKNQ